MASEGKERENYFKICVLVVDHIKNALVHMLKYYLREYKKMSFEEFINEHIDNKNIKYLRRSKILYKHEVDKLIVGDKAISGITVDNLELTLVRRLLDNLCPDLFMDDDCQTLQDFLKKNQHDIYHLFKYDERCCQYSDQNKCTAGEQLLKENEYKNMFESSRCTNCTGPVCSGFTCENTKYIKLDYRTRCTVFEHFSHIFKAVQNLKKSRDDAYGHIEAGKIPDDCYDRYYKAIEANIMVLARRCKNEDQTRLALDNVQKRSCDETLCKQYMTSISEEVKRDIELMEEIGKNRQILQGNSQILQENSNIQQENSQMLQGNSQILQESSNIQQENSQILQKNSQILQEIPPHLQKITEEIENLKVTKTNLTKDVGVSCGVTVGMQTLQETGTDAEPNISSVNNERVHDREKKRDGVVLHVKEDEVAAKEFINNMERENPDLDIGIISYDNLPAGTSRLRSAANVFHSYIYLFIFETENFTDNKFEIYISEIALVETLTKSGKQERLIPVAVEKDRTCDHPILAPLIPLNYYKYLEAKNSQQGPDQDFMNCFRDLITNGRQNYL